MRQWTAVVPLQRVNEPIFEYACHEGNYALRNLAGVRAQERPGNRVKLNPKRLPRIPLRRV